MSAKWLVVSLATFMAGAGAAPAEAWTTTRVSVGPGGIQSNGSSVVNAISADGRFVAFSSFASNLVAGDHNGEEDVFLRDLVRGETYLISTSTGGLRGNDLSDNTVHFTILMAAAKSIQVVGRGARGRSL